MADDFLRSPAIAMQDLLVEAMKRKGKRLNALAAEVLVGLARSPEIGQGLVHRLILEAGTVAQVGYRARLLDVVAQVGQVNDPADHLALFNLASDNDARVREAAARAVAAVRPPLAEAVSIAASPSTEALSP